MTNGFTRKALVRFNDPRNYGELEEPDGYARIGQHVVIPWSSGYRWMTALSLQLILQRQAADRHAPRGSMCTELAEGKTPREAMRISQQDILTRWAACLRIISIAPCSHQTH